MRKPIFFLLLLFTLIVTIALSRAAIYAVDVYASIQTQPSSAVETVLQSRQTPPLPNAAHDSTVISWLALGLLLVGTGIAFLRSGGEFLRQWRLLQRRQRPYRSPQVIPPTLPPQIPPVSEVGDIRREV